MIPFDIAELMPIRDIGNVWGFLAFDFGRWNGKVVKAMGDLAILIHSHLRGETPFGIVLDRLEEYPTELECDTETHRRILQWFRDRCPTSTENNW